MPKPVTKDELIAQSQNNFTKLLELVDSYSSEKQEKEFPAGTLNRNIRDVFSHLHHWHLMFLGWYEIGMQGAKPDMPAKGYRWTELPQLNKKIWSEYQASELHSVRDMVNASFHELQEIMEGHSNEELFEKKRYRWTGSTSLAAYLIANTSSHYNWAIKLIKQSM